MKPKIILLFILSFFFIMWLQSNNINLYSYKQQNELIQKINTLDNHKRNKIIYFLYDFISQIEKEDIYFWPFEVIRVIDGDTVEINYFWEKEKIRVYDIDTPERKEPWYEEAKQFAINLLLNEEIYIKRIDKDRWSFWRLIREIYIDWVNYWELLIKKGHAQRYK